MFSHTCIRIHSFPPTVDRDISWPGALHQIQANMGGVLVEPWAVYSNGSMTYSLLGWWTGTLLLTLQGEGGVTTFTNSPFICFLLLLQMYANAEVFIFLPYFLFALWFEASNLLQCFGCLIASMLCSLSNSWWWWWFFSQVCVDIPTFMHHFTL